MKEGCIPEDQKFQSSLLVPVYKSKGDPFIYILYREIILLQYAIKVVERVFGTEFGSR